jgi:hypothetical protein
MSRVVVIGATGHIGSYPVARPASDYMTGQTLVVDGGCMAK